MSNRTGSEHDSGVFVCEELAELLDHIEELATGEQTVKFRLRPTANQNT